MGGGGAWGRNHWGVRWSSLWGHGPSEGCVVMGGGGAWGRSHWGLRWGSLWGHEPFDGCAE
eukprot:9253810-Pyramimonas_sp.AAC.1